MKARRGAFAFALGLFVMGSAVGQLRGQPQEGGLNERRTAAEKPPVTALALTPDGKSIVSGSQAGLELRSWPDLQNSRSLPTEMTNIHDLAFSPDGRILAVAGGEPAERGTVELFAWPAARLLHRVHPHKDLVYAVAWRPDSAVFATGSADHTVGIHDAASGHRLRSLEGHSRGVLTVAFLPGDTGLLSAGIDETIRLWELESGQPLKSFANHTRAVNHAALRPLTKDTAPPWFASASEDRTVRLWQPTIGRMVRFVRLDSVPTAIAWSAAGTKLLVSCKDGHLRTIDPDSAAVIDDQLAIDGIAYCLVVAPDGSIAVGGERGQLRRIVVK